VCAGAKGARLARKRDDVGAHRAREERSSRHERAPRRGKECSAPAAAAGPLCQFLASKNEILESPGRTEELRELKRLAAAPTA
jgi:hypothetical protein